MTYADNSCIRGDIMTDELWERFAKSGKISDYLEYRRSKQQEEHGVIGNSERGNNS